MQYLRLFVILYTSAVLFGMNVGIQGIFTAVAKRGVFSNLCDLEDDNTGDGNTTTISPSLPPSPSPTNHSSLTASSSSSLFGSAFAQLDPPPQAELQNDNFILSNEPYTTTAPDHTTNTSGNHSEKMRHLPCLRQEHHIASIVNLMLSLTNFVSLPNGFLMDAIGGELLCIIAVSVWVLSTACAGISPGSGIIWTIAVCCVGWANSAAFMSFSMVQLRLATENDKGKFSFWSTVSMAARAVGALVAIPMAAWLEIESVEFWLLYMIWAGVIGLPIVVLLTYLYFKEKKIQKRKREEEAEAAAIAEEETGKRQRRREPSTPETKAPGVFAAMSPTLNVALVRPTMSSSMDNDMLNQSHNNNDKNVNLGGNDFDDESRSEDDIHAARRTLAVNENSDDEDSLRTADSPANMSDSSIQIDAPQTQRATTDTKPPASPTAPKPPATFKEKIRASYKEFRAVCFTLPFISITCRMTMLITFSSLFIANIGAVARYHGADDHQVAQLRKHFVFFLGGIGVTNPIPGLIVKKLQIHKGIALVTIASIIFSLLYSMFCVMNKGKVDYSLYLCFIFFSLWRYWGFGVASLYVPTVFPNRQAGFGLIFGTMSFVAGTVSVFAGGYFTYVIQHHPDSIFIIFAVFVFLSVLSDISSIVSMVVVVRQKKREDKEKADLDAEQKAFAEDEARKKKGVRPDPLAAPTEKTGLLTKA